MLAISRYGTGFARWNRRILLGMQAPEIEVKLPIPDPEAFERKVASLGFHLDTPRTFEKNTLYDTPGRDLRNQRSILRIRYYGEVCTLTHKRMPSRESIDPTRYKERIETETTVADGDALAEVFHQLGYEPAFVYEKYRTEWSQPLAAGQHAHLVVDETPIGMFAELEGPTGWIDETLEALGVDPASCMTDSYGRLFLDWKQRTGSPAENLTFAEVAPAGVGR